VFIGEVGLGGEIRAVSQTERRIAEAEKMGMKIAYVSERSVPKRAPKAIKVEGVPSLTDLFKKLFR
jgi:DNA repair protein RadA/Sms